MYVYFQLHYDVVQLNVAVQSSIVYTIQCTSSRVIHHDHSIV